MEREKIITAVIVVCFFGGLVGGPIASLADYHGSPDERFRLLFRKLLVLLAQAFWSIMENLGKKMAEPEPYFLYFSYLNRILVLSFAKKGATLVGHYV